MKFTFIVPLLLILFVSHSKAQDEPHIGLMFNIMNTTLRVPNGELFINTGPGGGISEGSNATGYKTNFALGIYGTLPINYRQNFGLEAFYDKTSSEQLEDIDFSAINLVPFIDYDIFDINLYLNIGFGAGFILDSPEFMDASLETKKVDFFAKVAVAYKFKGIGRLEFGTYPGVTEVVKDRLSRGKYYFGVKLPIDEYFGK